METKEYPATLMTPNDVPHDPTQGYELVKNLIYHQVHKFHNRFGGDLDDLIGEANLAFVQGHTQYITGHRNTGRKYISNYATEVRRWVWYELFDAMRAKLNRDKIVKITPYAMPDSTDFAEKTSTFSTNLLMEDLSEDARYAVRLVLDPNADVKTTAEAKGGEPRNYRSTVREYLAAEKWTAERINSTFEEIRRALG